MTIALSGRTRSGRRIAVCAGTALLVVGCLAGSIRPAMAGLNPDKPIGQFVRTIWEASTGLPQNSVLAMLQTRDGYVWIGTEEGLVRFDGERFEVFNRTNTPELPGQDVKSLFEAPDGSLWIGMVGGLARLKDGKFTAYSLAHGLSHDWISAVTGDRAGNHLARHVRRRTAALHEWRVNGHHVANTACRTTLSGPSRRLATEASGSGPTAG